MIEDVYEDRFNLIKNSFLTIGSIYNRCLNVVPPSKGKKLDELVIGDCRGILYLVDHEKQHPFISKKSDPPFKSEITCIAIVSYPEEKVYFSYGSSIFITDRFHTKLSKIEFDIPDKIYKFIVRDNHVWTVSGSYVNCYEFGECTTEICTNDVENEVTNIYLSEAYGKTNPLLLAGTSNKLKIFKNNELCHNMHMSSSPNCFETYKTNNSDLNQHNILFGTIFGSFGMIRLDDNIDNSPKILFERNSENILSEIVSIRNCDINKDSKNEVLLIRKNGDLEIYSINNNMVDNVIISFYKTNEMLTCMEIGNFQTLNEPEIILATMSGLVFSLVPNGEVDIPVKKQIDANNLQSSIKDLELQISHLEGELKKSKIEKEGIHSKIVATSDKGESNSKFLIRRNPFKHSYKYNLLPDESLYELILESEFPLDVIVLQADVSVEVMEIITQDMLVNIIKNEENEFVATLRLKNEGNNHSASLKVRTHDTKKGSMKCTLIPMNVPKTAFIIEIPIKALPLYQRISEDGNSYEKGCIKDFKETDEKYMNRVKITGNFSSIEINQILSELLLDIPEKTSKEKIKYYMKDSFLNIVMCIEIENESCTIRSVNFTPLMIIKEQISIITNLRRKSIESQVHLELASIFRVLKEINPLIIENYQLETKHKILNAFKEIDINGLNLPEKYKDILDNKDKIKKNYTNKTVNLKFMEKMLLDLLKYVSKVTQINNYNDKIAKIVEVLNNYSTEKIIDAFKSFSSK